MQSPFLPLPPGFTITALEQHDGTLLVHLRSLALVAMCPLCSHASERTHSRYIHMLADLPHSGKQIRLVVEVRRFFCDQTTCARKLFVERLPDLTRPWARMTNRLVATLKTIGLATNGEGARAPGCEVSHAHLTNHALAPEHVFTHATSRQGGVRDR